MPLKKLRQILGRPVITLALFTVVMVDLFTLKPGPGFGSMPTPDGSRVANIVGSIREPLDSGFATDVPEAYIGWSAADDELRMVNPDERYAATYQVRSMYDIDQTGWWGITREARRFSWSIDETVHDETVQRPADLVARANDLFYAIVWEAGDPRWIRFIEEGNARGQRQYEEVRHLWTGYLRNVASSILVLLLILSLGWVVQPRRTRRRWTKLGREQCPDCGYRLSPPDRRKPCAECGVSHPPLRTGAGARKYDQWFADRTFSRIVRGLRKPAVSGLLVVLLVHDVLTLPHGDVSTPSRVASWLSLPKLRADAGDGIGERELWIGVINVGGEDKLVLPGQGGAPEGLISIDPQTTSSGFWAPVRAFTSLNIQWRSDWDGEFATLTSDKLRDKLVEFLREQGLPQLVSIVEQRYFHTTLWTGHVHNAFVMIVFLALFISLGWIPERIGDRRGQRRERNGRCGYCTASLELDDTACSCCGKPRSTNVSEWARSP